MKVRFFLFTALIIAFLAVGCGPTYQTPYLSLSLESVYNTSDITINYTYVCEEQDQRCVYSLYASSNLSVMIYGEDKVLPSTGVLDFSDLGLKEGSYRFYFSIYSEKDGVYSLLKFLDESYEFSIAFP